MSAAVTNAILRAQEKRERKAAAWIANDNRRNASLTIANLAIAFFAWEDGYLMEFPTQNELDALWAKEENQSLSTS